MNKESILLVFLASAVFLFTSLSCSVGNADVPDTLTPVVEMESGTTHHAFCGELIPDPMTQSGIEDSFTEHPASLNNCEKGVAP